ncbi:MAG: hypothetical protein ACI4MJ_09125 [Aristaeellaceae bacterium]
MALKEKALRRLADKLNAAGIVWAAGGEWLLCYRGLTPSYHQFDIIIAQQDAERADHILSRLGMRSPVTDVPDAFRCDYHFDGADIAVTAGMTAGGQCIPFGPEDIAETVTVLGASVPVMHLSAWQTIYALQGKTRLAELIAAQA